MKINYKNKSMLYLKEKEMLISLTNETEIYIWSTVSYQLITTIKYDIGFVVGSSKLIAIESLSVLIKFCIF